MLHYTFIWLILLNTFSFKYIWNDVKLFFLFFLTVLRNSLRKALSIYFILFWGQNRRKFRLMKKRYLIWWQSMTFRASFHPRDRKLLFPFLFNILASYFRYLIKNLSQHKMKILPLWCILLNIILKLKELLVQIIKGHILWRVTKNKQRCKIIRKTTTTATLLFLFIPMMLEMSSLYLICFILLVFG